MTDGPTIQQPSPGPRVLDWGRIPGSKAPGPLILPLSFSIADWHKACDTTAMKPTLTALGNVALFMVKMGLVLWALDIVLTLALR